MNKQLWVVASIAAVALSGTPAAAQDAGKDWSVTVAPFLWATTFDNDVKNSANGHTSGSKADFFDILGNLHAVFLGKTEVQYKRAGVIADLVYLKEKDERTTTRPPLGPVETEATISNTAATLTGFYRVVQTDDLDIDVLAGARYVKAKLDFDVQGPGGRSFGRDGSADVTKGIVGVRATKKLSEKLSMTGYGDFGGFSGSTTVWQVEGTLNYTWSPKVTAFAGYRHFELELSRGTVTADVSYTGPVFGAAYRF